MKKIFTFIIAMVLLSSCGPRLADEMQDATITYEAASRGFYLNVEIKGDKMTIIRQRESLGKEYVLSNQDYKEVKNLYHQIKLKELADYKSPTEKRFYDGAAIANLSVMDDGKTYQTQSFDHGNPPVEIADFITKIVSFTQED